MIDNPRRDHQHIYPSGSYLRILREAQPMDCLDHQWNMDLSVQLSLVSVLSISHELREPPSRLEVQSIPSQ